MTVATYVVTATDNTALSGASPSISSVPGAPSAARSVLTAVPTTFPADGQSKSAITLQAEDANGNAVHASAGTAVISSTAGTISATTDNQNGTYSATLTAPTVTGLAVVSATLASVAVTSKDTVTVTTNAGTQYVVTSSSPSPVAGSAVTISAQLANSSGVAVAGPGHVVTWHVTGLAGTFGASTSTTNASGIATVTYTTSTTAGLATVSGTDAGSLTGSLALTSVAGSATHYVVTVNDHATPVVGSTVTITAQPSPTRTTTLRRSPDRRSRGASSVRAESTLTPTTSVTSATGAADDDLRHRYQRRHLLFDRCP